MIGTSITMNKSRRPGRLTGSYQGIRERGVPGLAGRVRVGGAAGEMEGEVRCCGLAGCENYSLAQLLN